ncbi:SMC-Scp complex subunit ScpB [Candidatus Latescibacterota bacterium]
MHEQVTKKRILEAVLFASDIPVEMKRLREIIDSVANEGELLGIIDILNDEYEREGRPFRVVEVAGGFQYETLPRFGPYIEKLYRTRVRPKLSRASLETLAIVAYKQPISKAEVGALRGVDSEAPLNTLQNRGLIEVTGRAETVGKPLLYGTTVEFLRYFGLNDIKDLPGADELASMFDGTEFEEPVPEQLSFDTPAGEEAGS